MSYFLRGFFTLFRDEFYQWEDPKARQEIKSPVDYDALIADIGKKQPAFKLDDDIYLYPPNEHKPYVGFFWAY